MRHNKFHTLKLIIAELDYYKNYLFIISILCLLYTIIMLTAAELFQYVVNWYQEFWTWCIAMSSYYIMMFIWGSRFKKNRDRVINLLPVSLNSITWFRALFSVALPLAFIAYIYIAHLVLINEWRTTSINLIGFMSKVIVIFPALNILVDMRFIKHQLSLAAKIILVALTASIISFMVVLLNIHILPLVGSGFPGGIILLELLFGAVLISISMFVFKKRKSFIT